MTTFQNHFPTPLNGGGPIPHHASILELPLPGGKGAPKIFKGSYAKIAAFLDHYNQICVQFSLRTGKEKCDAILRYCSRKVQETIQGLHSYRIHDYSQLTEDLLELYDDELLKKRFKKSDLEQFLKKNRKTKIRTLGQFKSYNREFTRIGGWLKGEGKLSTQDFNEAFWKGLPDSLCKKLEYRLIAQDPMHDMKTAFSKSAVESAATRVLQRDRFDADRSDAEDSDDDTDSDSEEDSNSESDDDSEDESDPGVMRRKKIAKKMKKHQKKKKPRPKGQDDEDDDWHIPQNSGRESEEIENLIHKLDKLSVNSAEYASLWYRAIKKDPKVEVILATPRGIGRSVPSYPVTVPPAPYGPSQNFTRQPPPHFPQPPFQNSRPYAPPPMRVPMNNRMGPGPMRCFGCGEDGHSISRCESIDRLINTGVLKRDPTNRLVWKNGSPIMKGPIEPIVRAVERQTNNTHLVTIEYDENETYYVDPHMDAENESSDSEYDAFEVERPDRTTRSARRQVMKDVLLPKRKVIVPEKENNRPTRMDKGKSANTKERMNVPAVVKAPEVVPVEVHRPRFNPKDDEELVFVEPLRPLTNKKNAVPREKEVRMDVDSEKRAYAPRKSDVMEKIDLGTVMKKVLDTQLSLSLAEIMGVSREMSGAMTGALKMKKPEPVIVGRVDIDKPRRTFVREEPVNTLGKEKLIKICVECDGRPIEAVVDSGSMLNIMSTDIAHQVVRRPVDKRRKINMSDANGGTHPLDGIASGVPLKCGSIPTITDIFVADHVPFDLLLGRPWQRRNMVGIDERQDGTYLVFKEPDSDQVMAELLVIPEIRTPARRKVVEMTNYVNNLENELSAYESDTTTYLASSESARIEEIREGHDSGMESDDESSSPDERMDVEEGKRDEWSEEEQDGSEEDRMDTQVDEIALRLKIIEQSADPIMGYQLVLAQQAGQGTDESRDSPTRMTFPQFMHHSRILEANVIERLRAFIGTMGSVDRSTPSISNIPIPQQNVPLWYEDFVNITTIAKEEWERIQDIVLDPPAGIQDNDVIAFTALLRKGDRYRLCNGGQPRHRDSAILAVLSIVESKRYGWDDNGRVGRPAHEIAEILSRDRMVEESGRAWCHLVANMYRDREDLPLLPNPPFLKREMLAFYEHALDNYEALDFERNPPHFDEFEMDEAYEEILDLLEEGKKGRRKFPYGLFGDISQIDHRERVLMAYLKQWGFGELVPEDKNQDIATNDDTDNNDDDSTHKRSTDGSEDPRLDEDAQNMNSSILQIDRITDHMDQYYKIVNQHLTHQERQNGYWDFPPKISFPEYRQNLRIQEANVIERFRALAGTKGTVERGPPDEQTVVSTSTPVPLWYEDHINILGITTVEWKKLESLLLHSPLGLRREDTVAFNNLLRKGDRLRLIGGDHPRNRDAAIIAAISFTREKRYEWNNTGLWEDHEATKYRTARKIMEQLACDESVEDRGRAWFHLMANQYRTIDNVPSLPEPPFLKREMLAFQERFLNYPGATDLELNPPKYHEFEKDGSLMDIMDMLVEGERGTRKFHHGLFEQPGQIGHREQILMTYLEKWGFGETIRTERATDNERQSDDARNGLQNLRITDTPTSQSEEGAPTKRDSERREEVENAEMEYITGLGNGIIDAPVARKPSSFNENNPSCFIIQGAPKPAICAENFYSPNWLGEMNTVANMEEEDWRTLERMMRNPANRFMLQRWLHLKRKGYQYRLLAGLSPRNRDAHLFAAQEIVILARYRRDRYGRRYEVPDHEVADSLAENPRIPESARCWFHIIRNAERAKLGLPRIATPPYWKQRMLEFSQMNLGERDIDTGVPRWQDYTEDYEMFASIFEALRTNKRHAEQNGTVELRMEGLEMNEQDAALNELLTYLEAWGLGEECADSAKTIVKDKRQGGETLEGSEDGVIDKIDEPETGICINTEGMSIEQDHPTENTQNALTFFTMLSNASSNESLAYSPTATRSSSPNVEKITPNLAKIRDTLQERFNETTDHFGHELMGTLDRHARAEKFVNPHSYRPGLLSMSQVREVGFNVSSNGTISYDIIGMGASFVFDPILRGPKSLPCRVLMRLEPVFDESYSAFRPLELPRVEDAFLQLFNPIYQANMDAYRTSGHGPAAPPLSPLTGRPVSPRIPPLPIHHTNGIPSLFPAHMRPHFFTPDLPFPVAADRDLQIIPQSPPLINTKGDTLQHGRDVPILRRATDLHIVDPLNTSAPSASSTARPTVIPRPASPELSHDLPTLEQRLLIIDHRHQALCTRHELLDERVSDLEAANEFNSMEVDETTTNVEAVKLDVELRCDATTNSLRELENELMVLKESRILTNDLIGRKINDALLTREAEFDEAVRSQIAADAIETVSAVQGLLKLKDMVRRGEQQRRSTAPEPESEPENDIQMISREEFEGNSSEDELDTDEEEEAQTERSLCLQPQIRPQPGSSLRPLLPTPPRSTPISVAA